LGTLICFFLDACGVDGIFRFGHATALLLMLKAFDGVVGLGIWNCTALSETAIFFSKGFFKAVRVERQNGERRLG